MDRKYLIETDTLKSQTNRHFYTKRKKSVNHRNEPKMQKALKFLIKQTNVTKQKLKEYHLKTEKNYESLNQSLKIQEIMAMKKKIVGLLEKLHPGWNCLMKAFENVLEANSMGKLEQTKLTFYERFYDLVMIYISKKKPTLQDTKTQKVQSSNFMSNTLFLQNLKLQKQNSILRQSLTAYSKNKQSDNPDSSSKNKQVQEEQKCQLKILERKLSMKTQENQILAKELEYIREEIHMMRDDKKNLQERISELKIKNQNLCAEIIAIQLKSRGGGSTKQKQDIIMMMQKQEIESYQREVFDQKKIYTALLRKYNNLISKFKKMKTDNNCKIAVLYSKQSQFFPEQMEAFQEIRIKNINFICQLHAQFDKTRDKKNNEKKMLVYQQYLGNKETINNKQGVKKLPKCSYHYYLPTFYHLVAEDIGFYGIDQNNFEHFNQKIKLSFLGTLRAILDSKYNQFLMYPDFRQITSFPSFVFSWLHTYEINSNKKVDKIDKTTFHNCRQITSLFYVNLMSEKLNYSWEVITFREFLMESFRADQLYYYLGVRFFILEGEMLTTLDSCFEEIYYIDSMKAMRVVHHFVKESDAQYLKILEEFVKRGLVYFRKKSFIDMHYLLRMLLEYYQYKKQQYIQKIVRTIDVVTQNKKLTLDFIDYLKIVDFHFQYLSLSEKLQLYRKCYCLGKGRITFEVFMSVFNSENIFVGWIQKVILSDKIIVDEGCQGEDSGFNILPKLPYLYILEQKYRYIHNAHVLRESNRMGVQKFHHNYTNRANLTNMNIHDRFEDCFNLCMFISKKFYRSNIMKIEQMEEPFMLIIQFLAKFSRLTMQRKQIKELREDFKYEGACRRIVRFYQKKKVEMTRSIQLAYSNNQMRTEEEQKNELLRTEFMNIITSMKKKNKENSNKYID